MFEYIKDGFCVEAKDCGPPDKPKNCNMDGKNYHFPGVVNFTSDRGYCVDGATQLKCTSNGTWSKELTTCKRKSEIWFMYLWTSLVTFR